MVDIMHAFKDFCGLLWAHGAMDDMQIHVYKFFNRTTILSNQKVRAFKCKLVCTITWSFKMCLFIFQVLSMMFKFLYFLPTCTIKPPKEIVVDQRKKCVQLHLLGDKNCPLSPWLMVPHKQSTLQFFQSLI